jgi:pimeloyl-ACP methyl ester carboxylesterase
MATLRISRRFNGPPDSGNGGYVAGLLAAQRDERTVTVILRSPPPLETALDVRAERLYDGDTLIAESESGELERDAPARIPFADATEAARGYTSIEIFASCFVCGSGRADGLRIEPGRVDEHRVAAPWIPDDTVPLGPPLLWAAMDCPGGWSLPGMLERPALLGSMTATVHDIPEVDERCVVVGEFHREQGRKCWASTAVYGADERLLGQAEQVWIRLP